MGKKATIEVGSVAEFHQIIQEGGPVLVDYYADWCGPCRALAPIIERVSSAHAGRLRVLKVNTDLVPELAQRSRVRELPALHFYREGRKVAALSGFRTDDNLRKELLRFGLITETAATPDHELPANTGPGSSLATRLVAALARFQPRREEPDGNLPPGRTVFRYIESGQDLADLLHPSTPRPAAIFLHDPWCPISARAFREMQHLGGELPTIDVSRHHQLSSEIERRTGIRHESPQVIVLQDAAPIWNGSHGRVTAAAVRAALGEQPTVPGHRHHAESLP